MFGKLTLAQKKALQTILIQSGAIALSGRTTFLMNAGLERLLPVLPLGEVDTIFAGALVRECERLGAPPDLGEYATVLLIVAVRHTVSGFPDMVTTLNEMIAAYVADHAQKYPLSDSPQPTPPTPATASTTLPPLTKILFLAANPATLPALQLDQEMREIAAKLRDGDARRRFDLKSEWVVRADQLTSHLLFYKPTIVHFAGHGEAEAGVYLLDRTDTAYMLAPDVFADLFTIRGVREALRCVLINACWSEHQAQALVDIANVPHVIGMREAVPDRAARAFAGGFYLGLSNEMAIPDAFELACVQMAQEMNDRRYRSVPRLLP